MQTTGVDDISSPPPPEQSQSERICVCVSSGERRLKLRLWGASPFQERKRRLGKNCQSTRRWVRSHAGTLEGGRSGHQHQLLQRHPVGCELKWFDVAEVIGDLEESGLQVVMGVKAKSHCVELGKAGKAMGLKYQ